MSYQVIARKWRPQTFSELVGQEHVSQTLLNALKGNRMPHAILFTGPRGTGKTSSARILAKSLCCSNPQEFMPCDICPNCKEITLGRHVDVIEIDGASNNGVDAIRELRETVGYSPSSGRYKVYIIDEVHMLTGSAFNALLKTLEEPPSHVVFIMATTEAHKIPQTILSRCQCFDFRRIPTRKIKEHLQKICETEQIPFEEEALWLIARQGDGSMRDSQSLLEQVITFTDKNIEYQKVIETLGLTDRQLVFEALQGILERQASQVISVLERFHRTPAEPHLFAQEIIEVLRHLTIVKVAGPASQMIVDLQESEVETLTQWADTTSEEELHFLFDMALKGLHDLTRSFDARLVLEMVLLRMVSAPKLESLSHLLQSLRSAAPGDPVQSERKVVSNPRPFSPANPPISQTGASQVGSQTGAAQAEGSQVAGSQLAGSPIASPQRVNTQGPINDQWLSFLALVKKADGLFGAKLEGLLFLGQKDRVIQLGVPEKTPFLRQQLGSPQTIQKLQSFIDQFWAKDYTVDLQVVKEKGVGFSANSLAEQKEQEKKNELEQQIQSHPLVKTAQALFKSQIKSIKELP